MTGRDFNQSFSQWVQKSQPKDLQPTLIIKIFILITYSMSPAFMIVLLSILAFLSLVFHWCDKEIIFLTLSTIPIVFGSKLKKKLEKERPRNLKVWVKEKSHSFPSTHSAVSCSFYGFIAFLLVSHQLPSFLLVFPLMMTALISFSRIYLGVHYLGDVVAGWLLGLSCLWPLIFFYQTTGPSPYYPTILGIVSLIGWITVYLYYRKRPEEIPTPLLKSSQLAKRILTGVIFFGLAFMLVWFSRWCFMIFILVLWILGLGEILNIYKIKKNLPLTVIAIIYYSACLYLIVVLRNIPDYGRIFTLIFIITISVSDVAAYFVGKFFGRYRKIFAVSPNKSLEGTLTAIFFPLIITLPLIFLLDFRPIPAVLYILGLSLLGIIGDLLESWYKRKLALKDVSDLLPGHGGILDRLDSHLLAGVASYLVVKYLLHLLI